MFWFITSGIILGTIFYKRETITEKYSKFKSLNKLVGTRYKNIAKIICVSLSMIIKMYWIQFLQWCNKSIEYIDNKNVVLTYVLQGKTYKINLKMKRGPSPILLVLDQNNNDITEQVLPYLGPEQNWHNKEYTPSYFEKESITFELCNGEHKTFDKYEKLSC
jgi:hypothetical protein